MGGFGNSFRVLFRNFWIELAYVLEQLSGALQRFAFAVSLLPLAAAFIMALAFSHVGQFFELYTAYIEGLLSPAREQSLTWFVLQTLFATGAMILLSVTIYIANTSLGRFRIPQLYREYSSEVEDPRLRRWVQRVGVLAAVLPWIGLAGGINEAVTRASKHASSMADANDFFDKQIDLAKLEGLSAWSRGLESLQHPWLSFWPLLGISVTLWTATVVLYACWRQIALVPRAALRWLMRRPLGAMQIKPFQKANVRGYRDAWWEFRLVTWPAAQRRLRRMMVAGLSGLVVLFVLLPLVVERFAPWLDSWLKHVSAGASSWASGFWPDWKAMYANQIQNGLLGMMLTEALGFWIVFLIASLICLWFCIVLRRCLQAPGIPLTVSLLATAVVTAVAAAIFVVVVSGFQQFEWTPMARGLGPLAMAILFGTVVFSIVVALCLAARQTGIPLAGVLVIVAFAVFLRKVEWMPQTSLGWLIMGAVLVALVLTVLGFLVHGRRVAALVSGYLFVMAALISLSASPEANSAAPATLRLSRLDDVSPERRIVTSRFEEWYGARRQHGLVSADRPYPVFIVAAEGGGIYAAAATTAFLSRMQERNPTFAQHVFAISGVSGGAVGAMVFHGAVDALCPSLVKVGSSRAVPSITGQPGASALQNKVASIIKDDHLSPLVGLVVADFLGTFPNGDRAIGLERSLETTMRSVLDYSGRRMVMENTFDQHWVVTKPAPALVLNTTFVRGGDRVVFAPFTLDPKYVSQHNIAQWRDRYLWNDSNDLSLTRAAVTSARFPGILPAHEFRSYSRAAPSPSGSTPARPSAPEQATRSWSFVDGGYIDASGALTAQEIYRSLDEAFSPIGIIDLRLIILTSTQAKNPELGADGAELKDLAAPFVTLLNVRNVQSRIAVRETIAKIDPDAVSSLLAFDHPSQSVEAEQPSWKVTTVQLNQEDFNLELGWKISALTHELVSLQLGRADLCRHAKGDAVLPRHDIARAQQRTSSRGAKADDSITGEEAETRKVAREVAKTIRANSCVMASLERLLARGPGVQPGGDGTSDARN